MRQDPPESKTEYREIVGETARIAIEEGGEPATPYEMAFEEADAHDLIHGGLSGHVAILEHSRRGPDGWQPLVDDSMSWREVVRTLAFRTLQNDIGAEIQDRRDG